MKGGLYLFTPYIMRVGIFGQLGNLEKLATKDWKGDKILKKERSRRPNGLARWKSLQSKRGAKTKR